MVRAAFRHARAVRACFGWTPSFMIHSCFSVSAVSRSTLVRVSMRSRRSASACHISDGMVPVASGMRPAIKRGAFRARPDPAGRPVALATR